MFKILANMETDATFNQGSGFARLKQMTGPFYSIDLSSATDRFPIQLQQVVLECLSSTEVADEWRSILVDHPFHHPSVKHPVYYKTGQPMGAYSS